MQEITLKVNGTERTFSKQELIEIIEKHLSNGNQAPTEGVWFWVKPREIIINQKIFNEVREDRKQERTRKLILEAIEQTKKNPQKYKDAFRVMIPKKAWKVITVEEMNRNATKIGAHIADWVEWILVLAQRIVNGQSWEEICNFPAKSKWFKLIMWETGYFRTVGSCLFLDIELPDAAESGTAYGYTNSLSHTVPVFVS